MDASQGNSGPIEKIARDVECYLSSHPGAADTAAGIARWWLLQSQVETQLSQIELALELLVTRGVLRRQCLPDGSCVFMRASSTLG